jgi:hypothetical protein
VPPVVSLTLRDWYQVGGLLGRPPLGIFVVIVGDNPVGMVPLMFNRKDKQWIDGAASCSRYLSMGDPGATQISEARGVELLESFGGSLEALQSEIAEMAKVIQYPEPGPSPRR